MRNDDVTSPPQVPALYIYIDAQELGIRRTVIIKHLPK